MGGWSRRNLHDSKHVCIVGSRPAGATVHGTVSKEAGGSQVWVSPGLQSKTLSQNKKPNEIASEDGFYSLSVL